MSVFKSYEEMTPDQRVAYDLGFNSRGGEVQELVKENERLHQALDDWKATAEALMRDITTEAEALG